VKRIVGAVLAAAAIAGAGFIPAQAQEPPISEKDQTGGGCFNSAVSICIELRLGPAGPIVQQGFVTFCAPFGQLPKFPKPPSQVGQTPLLRRVVNQLGPLPPTCRPRPTDNPPPK
jgi:hypothetical protein